MPEVRKDVADPNSRIHQNVDERAINNIFLHDLNENMGQVISDFWAKEKHFRKQTGMYFDHYQWNTPDSEKGNLAVRHEPYSIPHTVVFRKVSVRATLKIIGMVSAKRHWGYVKHIKSGKRSHISTNKTEK